MRRRQLGRLIFGTASAMLLAPGRLMAGFQQDLERVLSPILEESVRRSIPTHFRDESDWGTTKKFTQRLKIRGNWKDPRLERVRKEKNHGDWIRYLGDIHDPRQDVQIWVENLHLAPTQVRCQIFARVKFTGEAEFQQWLRGARLLGVSVVADAIVQLRLDVEMVVRWNAAGIASSAELAPRVVSGALDLQHFYVHRIGKAHGQVAEKLGDELEGTLRRKLAAQHEKMVREANKQVAKELERGTLRIDLVHFLRQQLPS